MNVLPHLNIRTHFTRSHLLKSGNRNECCMYEQGFNSLSLAVHLKFASPGLSTAMDFKKTQIGSAAHIGLSDV